MLIINKERYPNIQNVIERMCELILISTVRTHPSDFKSIKDIYEKVKEEYEKKGDKIQGYAQIMQKIKTFYSDVQVNAFEEFKKYAYEKYYHKKLIEKLSEYISNYYNDEIVTGFLSTPNRMGDHVCHLLNEHYSLYILGAVNLGESVIVYFPCECKKQEFFKLVENSYIPHMSCIKNKFGKKICSEYSGSERICPECDLAIFKQ